MPAVTPNRPYNAGQPQGRVVQSAQRIKFIYAALLILIAVFTIRLFYLQVIRHDYYRKAALSSQFKEYLIPAKRGIIRAYDGDVVTPLVLNEKKYTLFADPKYIKDPPKEAAAVVGVIGGDVNSVIDKLKTKDTRYVILGKKLSKEQSDKILKLRFAGIGTREESYRTYPQGNLAAQLLGFVNDDGKGQYGLEQALDDKLHGIPGELKAITDASGVPLVSNKDNVVKDPKSGEEVQITIDVGLQRQVEDLLKAGLDHAKSKSGSAVVIDVNSGAVKAMASYPTYDPANVRDVTDLSALSNSVISSPLEIGSIMKPLTAAAAINVGVVNRNTSYYDHAKITIDGATVRNVEEDGGPGTKTINDILQLSLNTGAVYLLQQMGGGEVNEKARNVWYDYLTNHYGFGTATGIEQEGENAGVIQEPNTGFGRNITYANMAFGQGMSATLLQVAAAYAGIVNGGKYYSPHLVESVTDSSGKVTRTSTGSKHDVVSAATSGDAVSLLEYVFTRNHVSYGFPQLKAGYRIGGKTGTAQIAKPGGGYYDDRFNGTFAGFVGGDQPQYVVVVRVNEPGIGGYAGARAAAPLFSSIVSMMIDNYSITPKKT